MCEGELCVRESHVWGEAVCEGKLCVGGKIVCGGKVVCVGKVVCGGEGKLCVGGRESCVCGESCVWGGGKVVCVCVGGGGGGGGSCVCEKSFFFVVVGGGGGGGGGESHTWERATRATGGGLENEATPKFLLRALPAAPALNRDFKVDLSPQPFWISVSTCETITGEHEMKWLWKHDICSHVSVPWSKSGTLHTYKARMN